MSKPADAHDADMTHTADQAHRAPRRVLLTGAHPLARGIAAGLNARGDTVAVLDTDPSGVAGTGVPCSFASEAEVADTVERAVGLLGGLDQVVHTWVAPGLTEEHEFATLAEAEWVTICEASLEGAWWLMRHLLAPLRASGGSSVVVLVPSVALAGAAGYSMLATVAEGLRVLTKGCGRQWAQYGITANTIATAPHHWVHDEAGQALARAISLSVPAFGGTGDASADLAPLVAALAAPDAHFLTAGTLVADGGVWMGL
jgi:NAD(P)-dependent dehydrogenase (short-subunit alcohol dehydrogenase family)